MMKSPKSKPPLTISATDHARLTLLAEQVESRAPEIAEELLAELDRAKTAPDGAIGEAVVRMHSTVTYTSSDETRTVTLVFPGEADIAAGKVSILTPIGTALLGLSAGQSMTWTARDGRRHELRVTEVRPPEA